MRISSNEHDSGFDTFQDALRAQKIVRVSVDGELVKDCITADEEKGFAYIHCRDGNGKFVVEGDYLKSKRITGKVQIELIDRVS